MKKDLDYIAKVEKAIAEKYGSETIQNPKKYWDKVKENKYLKDLKKFYKVKKSKKEVCTKSGFVLKESKISVKYKISNLCPICDSYSQSRKDDLYMTKFECCFECYIQHVEDREERWKTGWRPKK